MDAAAVDIAGGAAAWAGSATTAGSLRHVLLCDNGCESVRIAARRSLGRGVFNGIGLIILICFLVYLARRPHTYATHC